MKEKIAVATITSKNQITLPKAIREQLQAKQTDQVEFYLDSTGNILVRKLQAKRLWDTVAAQAQKYGTIATPEADFGEDVGNEVIN